MQREPGELISFLQTIKAPAYLLSVGLSIPTVFVNSCISFFSLDPLGLLQTPVLGVLVVLRIMSWKTAVRPKSITDRPDGTVPGSTNDAGGVVSVLWKPVNEPF